MDGCHEVAGSVATTLPPANGETEMTYKGYRLRHIRRLWYVTKDCRVLAITPAFYDAENIVDRLIRSLSVA
jgi:hypothetical protein